MDVSRNTKFRTNMGGLTVKVTTPDYTFLRHRHLALHIQHHKACKILSFTYHLFFMSGQPCQDSRGWSGQDRKSGAVSKGQGSQDRITITEPQEQGGLYRTGQPGRDNKD
jgi:hypothetical protein